MYKEVLLTKMHKPGKIPTAVADSVPYRMLEDKRLGIERIARAEGMSTTSINLIVIMLDYINKLEYKMIDDWRGK